MILKSQSSQRKPLSLWLFSASSQVSENLDPLKTQIVRRNLAFLRAKQWLVHYSHNSHGVIDPDGTFYLALIANDPLQRKHLAHCKISDGHVTNGIARNHAQQKEYFIARAVAESGFSELFPSSTSCIGKETIQNEHGIIEYPVIPENLYTGEIIQFCGDLPHTLPILLALFMIAAYPKDKIESLGLSDPNLELVFQKQGFYGTAIPDIISWVADAIGVEPLHLGPFVADANHTGAPPYRASFWPPYSTLNPWGSIMFAQMVKSMENQLNIDFSTQVEILGPNGEPLFPENYHERFCSTQLCKAQQTTIPCEPNWDDTSPSIVSPYRESLKQHQGGR